MQTEQRNRDYYIVQLQNELREFHHAPIYSIRDYECLADTLHLSTQSLRRFFGKVKSQNGISTSSLNLICQYLGYKDWEEFCHKPQGTEQVKADLYQVISTFYRTIKKSGKDILDTALYPTHYYYSEIILNNKKYTYDFLKEFSDSPLILQAIFALNPYYDKLGTHWYKEAIKSFLHKDKTSHIQVSQNSLLGYGAYLEKNDKNVMLHYKKAEKHLKIMREEFGFMPWPETRFAILQMISAKLRSDEKTMVRIIEDSLKLNFSQDWKSRYFEAEIMYYAFCNALIWLGEIDLAIDTYEAYLPTLKKYHQQGVISSEVFIFYGDHYLSKLTKETLEIFKNPHITSEFSDTGNVQWPESQYAKIHFLLNKLKTTPKQEIVKRHGIKTEIKTIMENTRFFRLHEILPLFDR